MRPERIWDHLFGGRPPSKPKPRSTVRLKLAEAKAAAKRAAKAARAKKRENRIKDNRLSAKAQRAHRVRKVLAQRLQAMEKHPSVAAVDALVEIIQNPETPDDFRARACVILLRWGHGRPEEDDDVSG
jgi:hypothetical protein